MKNKYEKVKGCLISMALSGEFDVIVHGVNCFCTQKSGLAPQMVNAFFTNKFYDEQKGKGDINKLGNIDYQVFMIHENESRGFSPLFNGRSDNKYICDLTVINAYTQFNYGKNHSDGVDKPLDYEALTLCMRKINRIFAGKKIGMPKIGCGLAGGDWNTVEKIIKTELKNCNVTIVEYGK